MEVCGGWVALARTTVSGKQTVVWLFEMFETVCLTNKHFPKTRKNKRQIVKRATKKIIYITM